MLTPIRSFVKTRMMSNIDLTEAPVWIRFCLPLVVLLCITLIKLQFLHTIGLKTPFLLYFAVVILTTRVCGKEPALITAFASAILAFYFFIRPAYGFTIEGIVQVSIFIGECMLILWLSFELTTANKSLLQNNLAFRSLISKSSDIIILLDREFNIMYASNSVESSIGYQEHELLNSNWYSLVLPGAAQHFRTINAELIEKEGKSVGFVAEIKTKGGKLIWLEGTFTSLLSDPNIRAIVCNCRDITERFEAEQNREEFLGIASHELRNPLTTLKLSLDMLEEVYSRDEKRLLLNKAKMQVDRILSLTNDLLNVSKISSGNLDLKYEVFSFYDLLTESIETFQGGAVRNKITITGDLHFNLRADKFRLEQVIVNLLSNASKYSPPCSEIKVHVESGRRAFRVSVTDEGIGIDEDKLPSLFKKYHRIESSNKISGYGLGLYISDQIVRKHGGMMQVSSVKGKGSTFWFELPL